MVERVRNVIKRDSRKGKRALAESGADMEVKLKRPKKGTEILRRYPMNVLDVEEQNTDTLDRHRKAIATELEKSKPQDSVLLPLMRSTYGERRLFVLNEATSVGDILTKHPALHRPALVCFCIIYNYAIVMHIYYVIFTYKVNCTPGGSCTSKLYLFL